MALKPRRWRHSPFTALIMRSVSVARPPDSCPDIQPTCFFSVWRRRVSFVKVLGGSQSSQRHDCRFLWLLRMGNLIGGHYSYAQITLTFPIGAHLKFPDYIANYIISLLIFGQKKVLTSVFLVKVE